MDEESRSALIEATIVLSDNEAKPVQGLDRVRWEIETFG